MPCMKSRRTAKSYPHGSKTQSGRLLAHLQQVCFLLLIREREGKPVKTPSMLERIEQLCWSNRATLLWYSSKKMKNLLDIILIRYQHIEQKTYKICLIVF